MTTVASETEKLPPIHPGETLNAEFLLPMGITQYRLAKSIGVDARRIHAIVHRAWKTLYHSRNCPAVLTLL